MKKILILVLSIAMSAAFLGACFKTDYKSSDETSTTVSTPPSSDEGATSEKPEGQTCTITFIQDGQPNVEKKVNKGETLTDIPTPAQKTGYTVAWDREDFSNITGNITVNAVAMANKYTVTYDANGGTVDPASANVKYDSNVTLPTPTKENHIFVCWQLDGKAVLSGPWTIAKDVTLVALWEEVKATEYSVTFIQAGQPEIVKTVKKGEALTDIPTPAQKTGYTVAWDRTDFSNIAQNITVNAVAIANKYTVTYDANGGTVDTASATVEYDSNVTLPTPTKENHTFVCWQFDGKAVLSGPWTIAKDVTLVALWEEVKATEYSVTFIQAGQPEIVKTVKKGEALTDIPTPAQKTGYTVAWDRTDFSNITGNITVTAVETANKYTITYNADGGVVTPEWESVAYNSIVTLPTPTKDGYTFICWKDGENTVESGKAWTIAKDVELVALWEEIKVPEYTVKFLQDGQEPVLKTVKEGENLTDIPAPQAKKGYIVQWEEGYEAKLTNIKGDVTIQATETAKTYTVTLKWYTGKTETMTVVYGQDYEIKSNPIRTEYEFQGWKYEGATFNVKGTWNIDVDGEIVIEAQWKKIPSEWTNNY